MIKGIPASTDVREGKAKYKKKAAPVKLSVTLFLEIDCLRDSEKVCCNWKDLYLLFTEKMSILTSTDTDCLVYEHDRYIVFNGVEEFASVTYEPVTLFRKPNVTFAFWTRKNFEQIFT